MSQRYLAPTNLFYRENDPWPPEFPQPNTGDVYFNTVSETIRVFYDDAWHDASSGDGPGGGGEIGPTGPIGPVGPTGPSGPTGPAGSDGQVGPTGLQGIQGQKGDQGTLGPTGPQGTAGAAGSPGPTGPRGTDGTSVSILGTVANSSFLPPSGNTTGDGYITDDTGHLWVWSGSQWSDVGEIRGPQGEEGPAGPTGPQGAAGVAGSEGAQGDAGPTGPQGSAGLTGPTGPQGPQGADSTVVGPTGAVGPVGARGATGPAGSSGVDGPTGPAGPTAISSDPNNAAVLGGDGLIWVPDLSKDGEEVAVHGGDDGEPVGASLDLWVDLDAVAPPPIFSHDDLLGLSDDDHPQYLTQNRGDARYALVGRKITAGNGLSGGGALSADRTLNVGAGTGIQVTSTLVQLDTSWTDTRYIQHTESELVLASTSAASGTPAGGVGTVWVQY
jgi:hypothetical protein